MFNGKIHYKWPCSIVMSNYQRVWMWMQKKWLMISRWHHWNDGLLGGSFQENGLVQGWSCKIPKKNTKIPFPFNQHFPTFLAGENHHVSISFFRAHKQFIGCTVPGLWLFTTDGWRLAREKRWPEAVGVNGMGLAGNRPCFSKMNRDF